MKVQKKVKTVKTRVQNVKDEIEDVVEELSDVVSQSKVNLQNQNLTHLLNNA